MESYISIIRFVNNPISKESIALGLIIASADRIYYRVSERKLSFAKKLNPEYYALFKFALNKLTDYLQKDAKEHQAGVHLFRSDITKEYLKQLAIYQNGVLGFSDPDPIDKGF